MSSFEMTKNVFISVVLVVFIGIAVWLLIKKQGSANNPVLTESGSPQASAQVQPSQSAGPGPVIKLENGLEIQELVVGTGAEARSGMIVAVNYIGTLTDGTKFDSSYDHGQPFAFALGAGQVIKGWDLGVVGMKVGGKRKLVIPGSLAYGNKDMGVIKPNSTLVFEVELLAVQTPQPAK